MQCGVGVTDISQSQTDISQSQTDISQSQTDISQSQTDTSQSQTDISQSQTDISQSQTDTSQSQTEISQSPTEISQSPTEISQSQTEISPVCHLLVGRVEGRRAAEHLIAQGPCGTCELVVSNERVSIFLKQIFDTGDMAPNNSRIDSKRRTIPELIQSAEQFQN